MAETLTTGYLTRTELDERAALYAAEVLNEKAFDRRGQWLVFEVVEEYVAVPVEDLDEVATPQLGSALPGVHPSILGLLNLRGETLLVVDLAQAMGLRHETPAATPDQRILVIGDGAGVRTGLLIDRVFRVAEGRTLKFRDFASHDADQAKRQNGFVNGVSDMDDTAVGRLDSGRLLETIRQWAAG